MSRSHCQSLMYENHRPASRPFLGAWKDGRRHQTPTAICSRGESMQFTRLKESDEYRSRREDLRVAELALMDHVERVAELRRRLPADTVVDDYEFIDAGTNNRVRLSQLFTAPDRALIIYHFMYGKAETQPCRLCTMWIDGYNA